ncbi:hypothetical protein GMOD_00003203 [Pyrenophora seminiperda CCB06]|uniref:Uncharacterized protein n=1 Tax=Pyrenophora seminiperda CCB06 TaxID=1302712 RepID=A0A3M7MID1_9PLEO|nr:hypothetical protein GMOD_00003203 [Pyrenophora seminiperda CCB06]
MGEHGLRTASYCPNSQLYARSCLPNTEVIQEVQHPCQRACPAAAERGKFDTVCVRPLPGRSTVCADPGSGLTAHVTVPALTGPSLNVQHVPGAPWGAVVVHHGLLLCPIVSRSAGRTPNLRPAISWLNLVQSPCLYSPRSGPRKATLRGIGKARHLTPQHQTRGHRPQCPLYARTPRDGANPDLSRVHRYTMSALSPISKICLLHHRPRDGLRVPFHLPSPRSAPAVCPNNLDPGPLSDNWIDANISDLTALVR